MNYVARVLVSIALVALALLAWRLRPVLLLLFGAVIAAVIFSAMARLMRHLGLGHRGGVIVSVLALSVLTLGVGWLIGGAVMSQVDTLRENFGRAVVALRDWLAGQSFGPQLLALWDRGLGKDLPWGRLASAAGLTLGAVFNLFLILVTGVYLAVERDLYRDGLIRLVPPRRRALAGATLDACARALGGWLKGQALSMVFVGVATAVGLALVGAPLAMTLGLLAGLLDFVPYFGPIVAGVVAVLFAFTDGPDTALYVALVMLVVQQLESDLVIPLVQKWTVRLPPVLALFAVLVFGSLFGLPGVLLATPLMVVLMVLVRKVYVEHGLEASSPPGR